MSAMTLAPQRVDCEILRRLKRGTKHSLRVWKPLSMRCVLKTLRGKLGRESPKRTISTDGGIRLLQMVLEPNTGGVSTRTFDPQESHYEE